MRTFFIYTMIGVFALLPLGSVNAAEIRSGERASVSPTEHVIDDLYLAGGMVDSAGSITGDLFAAGGNVTVDGPISGDLMTGGGNVTILSNVADDVRAAGGTVTLAGSVGDDVIIAGGQTQLSGNGIGGDVAWIGGMLTVTTRVNGDMQLRGSEVYINAPVNGSIEFTGDRLVLGDGAFIRGDIFYRSPSEAVISDGAVIQGEVSYESIAAASKDKDYSGMVYAFTSLAVLIGFLVRLTGSLVVGLSLRQLSERVVSVAFERPFAELGRGFIGLIAVPIVAIALMSIILGLPLGILLGVAYVGLLILSWLMVPVVLGGYAYKHLTKSNEYKVTWETILIGVIFCSILSFIPLIGWLVQIFLFVLTIGAILNIKLQIMKDYMK